MGQPVPDDMDGRVLTEHFTEESLARRPVSDRIIVLGPPPSSIRDVFPEEAAMIRRRLQELGDLG